MLVTSTGETVLPGRRPKPSWNRRTKVVLVGVVAMLVLFVGVERGRIMASWRGVSYPTEQRVDGLGRSSVMTTPAPGTRRLSDGALACGIGVPSIQDEYRWTGPPDPAGAAAFYRHLWVDNGWTVTQSGSNRLVGLQGLEATKPMSGWIAVISVEASPGSILVDGWEQGAHCRGN